MTNAVDSPWTKEKVATLRQMWKAGFSASVIADVLGPGFTKNAVIGKVNRLGLKQRDSYHPCATWAYGKRSAA